MWENIQNTEGGEEVTKGWIPQSLLVAQSLTHALAIAIANARTRAQTNAHTHEVLEDAQEGTIRASRREWLL